MKSALERRNDEFLVMPLKHVLSDMDLVNHSGTRKLWAIAHENGPKMQKRRVFGHASQTCAECHGPYCHRGETTYAMGWLKWGPN
jgi:hypothetical protein